MVGVWLALTVFVAMFLTHLIYSHVALFKNKEPVLVRFMVVASIGYVVLYPFAASLPIVGAPVVGRLVDFVTGLCAMGFFVLGYIELWSLIERSFTLRILLDAADARAGLTREEIAATYSDGRGLDWMMEKRIDDLLGSRMLVKDEGHLRLTARARLIAATFGLIQRASRVG